MQNNKNEIEKWHYDIFPTKHSFGMAQEINGTNDIDNEHHFGQNEWIILVFKITTGIMQCNKNKN